MIQNVILMDIKVLEFGHGNPCLQKMTYHELNDMSH